MTSHLDSATVHRAENLSLRFLFAYRTERKSIPLTHGGDGLLRLMPGSNLASSWLRKGIVADRPLFLAFPCRLVLPDFGDRKEVPLRR